MLNDLELEVILSQYRRTAPSLREVLLEVEKGAKTKWDVPVWNRQQNYS
jgi:hypothetical protein